MNALYSLYDALVSINVPPDKARAVVDAMERNMASVLATKVDLELLEHRLEQKFEHKLAQHLETLEKKIDQKLEQSFGLKLSPIHQRIDMLAKDMQVLRLSMIVWLGSAQIVGMGLLFAALKLT